MPGVIVKRYIAAECTLLALIPDDIDVKVWPHEWFDKVVVGILGVVTVHAAPAVPHAPVED